MSCRFRRPQCVSSVAAQFGQHDPQVLESIVIGDAVDVIQDQRHQPAAPLLALAAQLTLAGLQAGLVEPLLELRALVGRAGNEERPRAVPLPTEARSSSTKCSVEMPHSSSQRRSSLWLPPAGRSPKCRSTSVMTSHPRHDLAEFMFRYRGTNICSHRDRTDRTAARTGGPDSNRDSWDQNPESCHWTTPQRSGLRGRRYYDASGVRAHRRHHRRRRRNAHAFQAAEGPPPALRPRADPVARDRGARGRRRQGRGRRQPEAAARGPVARGRRDRDPGAAEGHRRRRRRGRHATSRPTPRS